MSIKVFLILVSAMALHAEDAPSPTLAQLQQQITVLQRQVTEAQRDVFIYRQSFNACVDSQQQRAQQPPRPAPAKPQPAQGETQKPSASPSVSPPAKSGDEKAAPISGAHQ